MYLDFSLIFFILNLLAERQDKNEFCSDIYDEAWIAANCSYKFCMFSHTQMFLEDINITYCLLVDYRPHALGFSANATASSKVWELLEQLIKINHKMEIQIHTYSQKQFMGIIRTKSKKKSLICKNRLNALYSRMRNDKVSFDGLTLVESIHDNKFVEYVEELENQRISSQDDYDDDEVSSEEEDDAIAVDSDPKCAVCKCNPPDHIYDACSHLILCTDCAGDTK